MDRQLEVGELYRKNGLEHGDVFANVAGEICVVFRSKLDGEKFRVINLSDLYYPDTAFEKANVSWLYLGKNNELFPMLDRD